MGVGEGLFGGKRNGDLVGPEDIVYGQAVSQGFDVCGVEFIQLADVLDDGVELVGEGGDLVVCAVESGEFGDVSDLVFSEFIGHVRLSPSVLELRYFCMSRYYTDINSESEGKDRVGGPMGFLG